MNGLNPEAIAAALNSEGAAGCKGCSLFEKDLEKAFLTAWNGIVENREGFLPAWEKPGSFRDSIQSFCACILIER